MERARLRRNQQKGVAIAARFDDPLRRMVRPGRKQWQSIGECEESEFLFMLAFEPSLDMRAGPHQTRAYRGNADLSAR